MDETPFWHAMLPTLGMAAEFQKARGLFGECGFDYAKVCGVLGADHLYLLTAKQEGDFLSREGRDGLDALIRLFVIGRGMERTEAVRLLGAGNVECLEALGLLAATPGMAGGCFSPVMVHPTPSGPVMVC